MMHWHHQLKNLRLVNEQFLFCKNNKRNNIREYSRLTPSYDVVILD